jgi:uncharacterized protein (DUF427 family)
VIGASPAERNERVETVWQYPRPPRVEPSTRRVRVELGGLVVADSRAALRVLETSHPPGIYVPPADLAPGALRPAGARPTWCEWKGQATYYDLVGGDGRVARSAAWAYHDPVPAYAELRDHVSFYPGRVDRCLLDDEEVEAQEGDFYGGWRTADITGPFKGGPGTRGW